VNISEKETEEIIKDTHKKQLKAEEQKQEKEKDKKEKPEKEDEKEQEMEDDFLKTRIEDLDLSSRTMNALAKASIRTIGGLTRKREEDLLNIEGVGKKAISEIRRALGNFGLILK